MCQLHQLHEVWHLLARWLLPESQHSSCLPLSNEPISNKQCVQGIAYMHNVKPSFADHQYEYKT